MEVTGQEFHFLLPEILRHVAESRFVALDFEISGIPRRKARNASKGAPSKQSLQERYEETKAAAERYQLLQFGLTCVEEDVTGGKYVCRPYNICINPLLDRRLKLERDFTFQNGAVDFLLQHQFHFDDIFVKGVPYLSVQEEKEAKAMAIAELERKKQLPDIAIRSGDDENLELMRRIRLQVVEWLENNHRRPYLNVPDTDTLDTMPDSMLSNYQRRLVHQLVRAEYPQLVSASKGDYVQLTRYNKAREESTAAEKRRIVEQNISDQIGLRRVVQSLCHQSSHARLFADKSNATVPVAAIDPKLWDPHTKESSESEPPSHPMIVGHNVFIDLVFLCACFFGNLPDTIEEFQDLLALMFPTLLDTKYVAENIDPKAFRYKSSLEELDDALSDKISPVIELPEQFSKYATESKLHEAGYDSFITAKVLIRLAAEAQAHPKKEDEPAAQELEDDRAPPVTEPEGEQSVAVKRKDSKDEKSSLVKSWRAHRLSRATATPLNNMFDLLSISKTHSSTTKPKTEAKKDTGVKYLMSNAASEFWVANGNRLKVNGTVEECFQVGKQDG